VDGIFAAGDADTGASLVVRVINHGRLAAEEINNWLKNLGK
jgi:NADPH-dependent glutamate synthase beta subunit-like oxidoreductase